MPINHVVSVRNRSDYNFNAHNNGVYMAEGDFQDVMFRVFLTILFLPLAPISALHLYKRRDIDKSYYWYLWQTIIWEL